MLLDMARGMFPDSNVAFNATDDSFTVSRKFYTEEFFGARRGDIERAAAQAMTPQPPRRRRRLHWGRKH
jgi:hypothetical protein